MLSEYWHLRKLRDKKSVSLTESNPEVKMLDAEIAKMRKRFDEENERRVREKQFLVEDLMAEERGFEAAINEISDQLRQTPDVVARIEHLQKEIFYTYKHYEKVLEKMLDAVATEADDMRISNAKVIGTGTAQLTKAGRMQTVYVAFSVLLGVTLGIGFGFLLESLDHSVRSAADVEENLGLPLLGSIPDSHRLSEMTHRVDSTFRPGS